MPKSTILFKAPAVTVHRQPAQLDGTPVGNPAVLEMGNQSILLEAEAAELLVSYLQVIRAYFNSFQHSRKIIADRFSQIALYLSHTQQNCENEFITNRQVSDLIQQFGCVDDWQHQFPRPTE